MSGASIDQPQEISHLKNYLAVTADFSSAQWNTVASHELFTVNGLVRLQIIPECTEDLAGGIGATISLGVEGSLLSLLGVTDYSVIDAGELWLDATLPAGIFSSSSVFEKVINNLDVGYNILVNPLTDGTMLFHCFWEPLNALNPGTVVAGTGGSL